MGVMTFFPDPIKPSEGRQDDTYKVNAIEADPHKKETRDFQSQTNERKWKTWAVFLNLLTRFFPFFNGKKEENDEMSPFSKHLQTIKALFVQIQQVDQSANSLFCEELSNAWIALIQEAHVLSHTKQKGAIDLKAFLSLIDEIQHFPKDTEHQLGYYLSNYAGSRWLPVPFRDILKRLHVDEEVNQKTSVLSQWIQTIDHLLSDGLTFDTDSNS